MSGLLSVLQTVLPPPHKYLPHFGNPCWRMYMSSHPSVHKLLSNVTKLEVYRATMILSYVLFTDTPRLVCIPRVYHIGFPRTGSTFLYKALLLHPGIVPGAYKEPHWWVRQPFRGEFPYNVLSVLRYLEHFAPAARQIEENSFALTIDASQSTIWDGRSLQDLCALPRIMSAVLPNAHYIVTMRDPASRLFSDYIYMLSNSKAALQKSHLPTYNASSLPSLFHKEVSVQIDKFKMCLADHSLLACTYYSTQGWARLGVSLYYVHVAKWLEVIPSNQFLFLRTEDMLTSPLEAVQSVWSFIGVSPTPSDVHNSVLGGLVNVNGGMQLEMLNKTRRLLKEFYQPYNEQLSLLLEDKRFLWDGSV